MGTCVSPNWFSKCGGAQGTSCGTPAGAGEGCYEPNASSCVDCDRGFGDGQLQKATSESEPVMFMCAAIALPGKWKAAGLERGDLIIQINGEHIKTRQKLQKYLRRRGTLEIMFERAGSVGTVEVEN